MFSWPDSCYQKQYQILHLPAAAGQYLRSHTPNGPSEAQRALHRFHSKPQHKHRYPCFPRMSGLTSFNCCFGDQALTRVDPTNSTNSLPGQSASTNGMLDQSPISLINALHELPPLVL